MTKITGTLLVGVNTGIDILENSREIVQEFENRTIACSSVDLLNINWKEMMLVCWRDIHIPTFSATLLTESKCEIIPDSHKKTVYTQ